MKTKEKIPEFKTEVEEQDFWSEVDVTEYVDFSKAKRASFPNLMLFDQNHIAD